MTGRSAMFLCATLALIFALETPALQAKSLQLPEAASASGMVDGPGSNNDDSMAVRTIAQAGGDVWVGGLFNQVDDSTGAKVADAANLAVFDASTGLPLTDVHLPLVTSTAGTAEVFDSSVGPDGDLYIAGHFDAVDGQARNGVAAIDPATGTLLPFAPNAGASHSILAKGNAIVVGGTRLLSYKPNGSPSPGFTPPQITTDPTLHTELTSPQFRDITRVGGTLVAACQCDQLVDASGTHDVKAVVEINAATGALMNWSPAGLASDPAASGIAVLVHVFPGTTDMTVYLAAGGSDFTAAYDLTTGAERWIEDTSGSSQSIAWFNGSLIVGGHFDWTQPSGGPTCGDNVHPNRTCLFTPRLVAMSASSGAIVRDAAGSSWNPGVCCIYNGVWALLAVDGTSLFVGGQFTEAGGDWTCRRALGTCLSGAQAHTYLARFALPSPA